MNHKKRVYGPSREMGYRRNRAKWEILVDNCCNYYLKREREGRPVPEFCSNAWAEAENEILRNWN